MAHDKTLIWYFFAVVITTLYFLISGLYGLSEKAKASESYNIYESVNAIILGSYFIPFALLCLMYKINLFQWMSESRFCLLLLFFGGIVMFTSGLYVLLNKDKITNPSTLYFWLQNLIVSLAIFFGLTLAIMYRGW
jgi:hypothetical protein